MLLHVLIKYKVAINCKTMFDYSSEIFKRKETHIQQKPLIHGAHNVIHTDDWYYSLLIQDKQGNLIYQETKWKKNCLLLIQWTGQLYKGVYTAVVPTLQH